MDKNSARPLVLVDGSSYLYRAFHALPPLVNSKGMPTGAIYGVINMLRKLVADFEPDQFAVVFDAKGKTFRDDLYAQYKANRKTMPVELAEQVEPIHTIIHALGFPIIMIEGVEADDVIGTLAKELGKKGQKILISTSDKDLAQLVDENITLVNTMSGYVLTPQTVVEKFGIPADQIVDYLTLVGDSIDNIPGVPKVGPKTAVKWLQEYGSLDDIIARADEIKGKVGENLRAFLPELPLSRSLVTIKTDVDLLLAPEDLQRKKPDQQKLLKIYQELEFKSWLAELSTVEGEKKEVKQANYVTLSTEAQLDEWLQKLTKAPLFSFSIETSSQHYMEAKIVGLAFATEPDNAAYIPLAHNYPNAPSQLSVKKVLQKLKPLLENNKPKVIGHDIKQIIKVLLHHGIGIHGIAFDTMLQSYILDSSNTKHDTVSLARKYLDQRTLLTYEELAGKGVKQLPFNQIPIEKAAPYAASVADAIFQLHHSLTTHYADESSLQHVYENIELALAPVLARIESNGVLIDAKKLLLQNAELEKRLQELEKEIIDIAGVKFNISSPKQLQEILFDKLQLPILQKTPTGQPSTADNVLQELALSYPLPKLVIEHRSLSKLISTYTKKLPEQINSTTQRVHTSYNQTGAVTGRLSSSDPNLQNIPIRTPEGRRIRQAFIAPAGHKIMSADYSQIELRIMAHMSDDPNLLHAFKNDLDIHVATAAEILEIPLERVTADERRNAKAINFGLIYGMSAFGLAKQIGTDRQIAQKYIDLYFSRYPNVKAYMENTRELAHQKGYVETLQGRRLYLPDINARQIMRQKGAERAAINAPLQGTAADIIKNAMIALDQWLHTHTEIDAKIIMQVHDELVFEVGDKDIATMQEVIREHMMQAAQLKVPLLVSIGVGNNWDEASAH